MMKKLIFILLLLPLLSSAQSAENKFISVRGEAEISINPDWIELSISFKETENIRRENELLVKEKKLKNLVHAYGIDLKHLKVNKFSAYRKGYYNTSQHKVRVVKEFKLRLKKINVADSLIFDLFNIGAGSVNVTNIHSNRLEEIKLDLIKKALKNARNKAEAMASYSGSALGEVLMIQEIFPEQMQDVRNTFNHRNKFYNSLNEYNSTDDEIGVRKIKLRYAVNVKYKLND